MEKCVSQYISISVAQYTEIVQIELSQEKSYMDYPRRKEQPPSHAFFSVKGAFSDLIYCCLINFCPSTKLSGVQMSPWIISL